MQRVPRRTGFVGPDGQWFKGYSAIRTSLTKVTTSVLNKSSLSYSIAP